MTAATTTPSVTAGVEPLVLSYQGHLTRDVLAIPTDATTPVVVDLQDVTTVDLGALLALIHGYQQLRDRLVLRDPAPNVIRMLIACGLAPAVSRTEA